MSESEKLRLFCALDLPGETLDRIEAWQSRVAGESSPWRAVRREALHLTLAFLGNRSPEQAERAGAIVAGLAPAAGLGGSLLPEPVPLPRRRPRLLALGVEDRGGSISALQERLAAALVDAGLYGPEERPFWPHVTVMRRRRSGSGSLRVAPPDASGHAFGAVRVALYVSTTRPGGSEYRCLAARDLPSAGG